MQEKEKGGYPGEVLVAVPLGLLERIESRLSSLEDMMADDLNAQLTLTREDIARRQGVSLSKLQNEPWRLPNYGRPDDGSSKHLWRRETVKAWESASVEEHFKEWSRMTIEEQLRCRGVAEPEERRRRPA
jgi:hypothetical protein